MNKSEIIHGIQIPVIADSVLSPQLHYGNTYYNEPITGIYFNTEDEHFGRITFENLDSFKISRGEMLPFDYDWATHQRGVWVFRVENSQWLLERYQYEKKHYGSAYEFGGNVEEMKTHFRHYIFSFHDQFVEVIARGFWFEKSQENLFGKELIKGHPFLPLPRTDFSSFEKYGLICRVFTNDNPIVELIQNAQFCTQKLMEFALELGGKVSVNHTLTLTLDEEMNVKSNLHGYFGNKKVSFAGIATLNTVKPYLEKYMKEVFERRKQNDK